MIILALAGFAFCALANADPGSDGDAADGEPDPADSDAPPQGRTREADANRGPEFRGFRWLRQESFTAGEDDEAITSEVHIYRCEAIAALLGLADDATDVSAEFVLVDSGTYPRAGKHEVTVPSFLVGRTEITQGVWQAVAGRNPSHFGPGENGAPDDTSRHPVENVSWDDVHGPDGFLSRCGVPGARLPSESEWEYACRAGSDANYCFGNRDSQVRHYGWTSANASGTTHEVATRKPNAWGIHDMHGNVWEWCEDSYRRGERHVPIDGSPYVDDTEEYRSFRGGSWNRDSRRSRSDNRGRNVSSIAHTDLGFRLVVTASAAPQTGD